MTPASLPAVSASPSTNPPAPRRPGRVWLGWSIAYVAIVLLTATVLAAGQVASEQIAAPAATHAPPPAHAKAPHRAPTHKPPTRTIPRQPTRGQPGTPFGSAFTAVLWPTAEGWGIVFVLGLVIVAISKASIASSQRQQAEAHAAALERQHQVEAFMAAPLSPVSPDQLVLQAGETCYWQEPAQLMELRTHTHYEGGSLGLSVRIARGVYLRPGAFRGAPVSNTAMEVDDTGTVYVTNTRIVFIGGGGAKAVTLKQLAGVEPFTDGVRITAANRKPLALITGNFRLGSVIERATRGAFGASPTVTHSAKIALPGGAGPLILAALRHLDEGKRQGNAILFPARAAVPDYPVMLTYQTTGHTLPDGRILAGMIFAVDPKDAVAFEQEVRTWVTAAMGGQQALDAWKRAAATANPGGAAVDPVSREPNGQFSVILPVNPAQAGLALFGIATPADHPS